MILDCRIIGRCPSNSSTTHNRRHTYMPILNVSVSGQADPALSRSIATALSEAAAVHLHKDPGVTAVVIRYIAPESWFVGGDSLTGQGLKSFHLDIKVTAGTNT